MPFSEDTLVFLALNRVMNSREWFREHRAEYEKLVVEPLVELVEDLAPAMAEIDPAIVCLPRVGKSISRIWRDTRRGPELPIYRDVMWITLLREKYAGLPSYWFEFSPRALRWGCGWYQTPPEVMGAARELILSGDRHWLRAREAAGNGRFVLENELYKRTRHPDSPAEERMWLDQKSLCLTHNEEGISLLYSPELAERVAEDFRAVAPVYDFFMRAWERAPKETMRR